MTGTTRKAKGGLDRVKGKNGGADESREDDG